MNIKSFLEKGEIVVFNSDTITGLFARYDNLDTLNRMKVLKKRSNDKVFQVYIASYDMLKTLKVDKKYIKILEYFLPGPYTIIVPTHIKNSYINKDGFIGIRMIKNQKINDIITKVGPLAATSLNESGKPMKSLNYYKKRFKNIYWAVKSLKNGKASTVIKYDGKNFFLLRLGKGKLKKINVDFVIGSDHGGYKLKEHLKSYLNNNKLTYFDVGTFSEESVDYPDYAQILSKIIQKKLVEKGILICGTGIGMSIAANRFKNVRAALCHSEDYARLARQHNNANVLAMGGRFIDFKLAEKLVNIFIKTPFDGGRHLRRIRKIEKI